MDKSRIKYLLKQFAADSASEQEVEEMFRLMKASESDEVLRDLIMEAAAEDRLETNIPGERWDKMWKSIIGATNHGRKNFFSLTWVRVAAAVMIFFAAGRVAYWFVDKKTGPAPVMTTIPKDHYKNDVAPGGNKALLTLANGSTIVLDGAHSGVIARQGNTEVLKVGEGALTYHHGVSGIGAGNAIQYNVLTTPRGGQYEIVLPDGSKVWLNAASSLRFPTSFAGKQRVVELNGEAYFEVVNNPSMPFHVKVKNVMDVEDLGTHFDIMAYDDEKNIKATLIEGKVRVTKNEVTRDLVAGKQAVVNNEGQTIDITEANVQQALAWKDGYFRFKETNIRELMRQVERWYDVEVEYRTQRNDQDYTGIVSRAQNLSVLLHTLELTGTVHFEIEGKKIIVLP